MAVLSTAKRSRGGVMPAPRKPEPARQAVRRLAVLVRQVLADHGAMIPRAELWITAQVSQTAANLAISGKSTSRIALARIAEVLCRSKKGRPFVQSITTRRAVRQALEQALPVLEQGAPRNVRAALADVRHRLYHLGDGGE